MTTVGVNIPRAKTIRVALTALAVLALPGCGHSTPPIQRAIEASPLTFFAYDTPAWWGRPVVVTTARTVTAGDRAAAIVDVRAGTTLVGREDVALGRNSNTWQVLAASDKQETLPCMYAGEALSKRVFGKCGDPSTYAFSTVKGPVATRPPTPSELAGITASGRSDYKGENNCVRFKIVVSRVDSRYAKVDPSVYGPRADVCAENGVFVVVRKNGSWRYLTGASTIPTCRPGSPGAIRSLFGSCSIAGTPQAT